MQHQPLSDPRMLTRCIAQALHHVDIFIADEDVNLMEGLGDAAVEASLGLTVAGAEHASAAAWPAMLGDVGWQQQRPQPRLVFRRGG